MKIENNGISQLSSKSTDVTGRIEKKDDHKDIQAVRTGQDKAEMSENARLLAKSRSALGNVEETDSTRVVMLQKQVESGDYKVQVNELARKLVARFYPK